MELSKKETENTLRFPRSIYTVMVYQYCLRFAVNSLKYTLPLYFVDVLHCEESEATVYYHSFNTVTFFGSLLGGIIADCWLGRFKSILCFSVMFVIGLLLLSLSAVPLLEFPVREVTVLALSIAALSYGCARPCIPAFGGDQFILPQQEKQLPLLFIFISIALNAGSLSASLITPVLRKDLTCFGGLTCYSLALGVPAITMAIAGGLILASKKFYRILIPEGNIVLTATNCVMYALYQRIKTKKRQPHWLDHAADKYDLNLIEDIKSISQLLTLFIPLPVFWSLFSMQGSTWIFQSSRMNGEFAGYVIKPDQIQIVNPIFVIISIPIFYLYIYPALEKYTFINTPLRKLCVGLLISALSFYVSGIVELNLETTYAVKPIKEYAQLRIYNTLNCNVSMMIDENRLVVEKLNMWKNISIPAKGKRFLKYKADYSDCKIFDTLSKLNSGILEVVENQATSWAITKEGLSYKFTDTFDKSTSGNPLIRALIYVDADFTEPHATLNLVHNQEVSAAISLSKSLQQSNLIEVAQKSYDLFLNDQLIESNVVLKLGGVYTVVGYASNSNLTTVGHTVVVTNPNTVHIFWILPQQFLLGISEIMVDVLMMEFIFTQTPVSIKVFLQSCFLFTAALGNLIIILITGAQLFERKVFEIFLYAVLMTIGTVIFAFLAMFYKYKENSESVLDRPKDPSEAST